MNYAPKHAEKSQPALKSDLSEMTHIPTQFKWDRLLTEVNCLSIHNQLFQLPRSKQLSESACVCACVCVCLLLL